MDNDAIISFQNFGFQYTAQADPTLYNINLSIHRGEKVLIVGPSGCGKSTLAHCMNGLIPASYSGSITGSLTIGPYKAPSSLFDISKIVGTVLQDSDGQFIGLTVAEDIAFVLENECTPLDSMRASVSKISDLVHVNSVLHHAPHEISGGQKQRVALGGVMVNHVDLLLFDEPLANLDPATGKQAICLIDEIQQQTGCAVVIIEHRLEDSLYRKVDRIVMMSDGRITYNGNPDELLSSNLLVENGIREPLYVTALKYTGIEISPAMHPAYLQELILNPSQKSTVRDWFHAQSIPAQPSESTPVLEARDIDFTYDGGHHALKGINLCIYRGEMLSIVGTNGAGKSTFSKVVCGFEKPQKGSLLLNGNAMDALSIKQRADHIGYVMQNPNQMISQIRIFDEIALGLRNREVCEDEIRVKVENAMKICGLYPYRNWPVSALSYGQKKRVTIASILVLQPEIIILDEPTAGQDFRHYTEIMDFLRKLNEQGITILLITHDMHLMLEYTKRALVFHDGKLICDASPAQVLNDKETVEMASLKETSLYHLAKQCGIESAEDFTRAFISADQVVRTHD